MRTIVRVPIAEPRPCGMAAHHQARGEWTGFKHIGRTQAVVIELFEDSARVIKAGLSHREELVEDALSIAVSWQCDRVASGQVAKETLRRSLEEDPVIDIVRVAEVRQVDMWPNLDVSLAANRIRAESRVNEADLPRRASQFRVIREAGEGDARYQCGGQLVQLLVLAQQRRIDAVVPVGRVVMQTLCARTGKR